MYDFDQVVIGSGFGGSVSALRLTEKGNRVLVLEMGRRREDEDFAESYKDPKQSLWEPKLGWRGPTAVSYTSKVMVLRGIGVGGGSQIYANVHFVPDADVFNSPEWSRIHSDWYARLKPFYSLAQRMLGTTKSEYENRADEALKEVAKDIGREHTYDTVSTGVLFAESPAERGVAISDPYFEGDGPERNKCTLCARCVSGCRYNAKNTLTKNYLYFAERNGAEIRADSEVIHIEPLLQNGEGQDGSKGYTITVKETKPEGKRTYTLTTRGIVVSAGVMGSVPLLLRMRDEAKTLPNISKWLGQQIRTNSETLTTSAYMDEPVDEGVTISSIIKVDETTNMEVNRFSKQDDHMWLYTPYIPMVTGKGLKRILKFLANSILHPVQLYKMLRLKGRSSRSIVFLIMQTTEAFIHFEWKRKWYRFFRKDISAVQKADDVPLSVSFPAAEEATRNYAKKTGGIPGSSVSEVMLSIPTTAHIMSGVAIGKDRETGVIDESGEVFGYKNLRVLDGSIIPGNLGVNPSLTITALSEHAMSLVPVFDEEKAKQMKPIRFSEPLKNQVSSISTQEVHELIKAVNV